jgi:primosomal protein N' (replication factor Y)
MTYVEVMVGGAAYHGNGALTYGSEAPLTIGSIVTAPLRAKTVLGVVVAIVDKPSFKVKPAIPVADYPPLPEAMLRLLEWMRHYYPSPLGIIAQQFLPKDLPKKPVKTSVYPALDNTELPPLTLDQEQAINAIEHTGMHILHGETGTGKTRVYIELTKKALDAKKSAIILTPEIGLTPQLATEFKKVFGDRVIVIHSQLTSVTRQRQWVDILNQTEPIVIIGPRSALFSPLRSIGLIVIDEAHETSYKQDQAPYYHTTRVASMLASFSQCPVILGSATPLIADYFMAEVRKRPIIRMQQVANHYEDFKTTVSVVDLKDKTKFTKKAYISDELIRRMAETLAKKEQILLFLNRRGTARVVFCENCGWQASCPHCDLPLVYHGDSHIMRCHSCDHHAVVPSSCPDCHNHSIVFKSIGTKAIVDDITKLFPEARIQRFDTDNKKDERIEQHYPAIRNGEVDIIIGTQGLAKGLDLPHLGLVGVIIADTSLYFPDFSAQERTYQLLGQVLGRVGRGHRSGRAVIQTYNPDNPLLKSILTKEWRAFYEQELEERRTFLFPPFCYLLKLTCKRATLHSAQQTAQKLVDQLSHGDYRIIVEGPAPAFHEKVLNKYQWQIVIKSKDRGELLKVISALPSGWTHDIDPMNLL